MIEGLSARLEASRTNRAVHNECAGQVAMSPENVWICCRCNKAVSDAQIVHPMRTTREYVEDTTTLLARVMNLMKEFETGELQTLRNTVAAASELLETTPDKLVEACLTVRREKAART